MQADLLRFYGMTLEEATETMSGPEFFELTIRLMYYGGALSTLAEREADPQDEREEVSLDHESLAGIVDF